MQNKKLHIVTFDNPFPPNYGGVIDVFYKIKALHLLGVEIYLHCFVNEIPQENIALEAISTKLFFYKRNKSVFNFFSKKPFSVVSRKHNELLQNLSTDNHPIFFEGLQSTFVLSKSSFKGRALYLRLHNLEDNYYKGLAKSETSFFKRIAYSLESKKYQLYKDIFKKFEKVFTLSNFETRFIEDNFGNAKYIPVFHGNQFVENLSEYGNYAFYNGDLRISDNRNVAQFLLDVFNEIKDYKLIIASSISCNQIESKCKSSTNCSYISIKYQEHLNELVVNSHINVMLSFQESGTKLKAVNALYKGRFCIINKNMIDDDELLSLCTLAETKSDFVAAINKLKKMPYSGFEKRKIILEKILNDKNNAMKIIETIWK